MKKFTIIGLVAVVLLVGAWVYACTSTIPWLSDFARSTTHGAALSMGLHVFDPPATADASKEKQETVANLPNGFYLYVGEKPANAAPKWVVVNPGGTISWLDPGATKATPNDASPAVVAAAQKMPENAQFEEYAYPRIKWKAKPLPGPAGAVAQLSTTFERGDTGQPGTVKYRLTLFKSNNNGSREIQMLDGDGFKMQQFNASDFHQIPGSELMEARDSFPVEENEYRRWRDYSIN